MKDISEQDLLQNIPLVAKKYEGHKSTVSVGSQVTGGNNFSVIAGPCAVESLEQVLDIAKTVKKFFPKLVIKEDDYKSDFDNRNYIVSNKKLESLGWKPKYTIEDGITELTYAYQMIVKYNNRNFTNL